MRFRKKEKLGKKRLHRKKPPRQYTEQGQPIPRTRHQTQDGIAYTSKNYWWISGKTEAGKPILWGAYNTEEAARKMAWERLGIGGDWSVIPLPTRSVSAASRMVKARKLKGGDHTPDEAMRRLGHKEQ